MSGGGGGGCARDKNIEHCKMDVPLCSFYEESIS